MGGSNTDAIVSPWVGFQDRGEQLSEGVRNNWRLPQLFQAGHNLLDAKGSTSRFARHKKLEEVKQWLLHLLEG